jgi:RHS repeat-associated protein
MNRMGRWFVQSGLVFLFLGHGVYAEVHYFHSDHLGSMAVGTNSAGTVQQVECYTPFGESFTPHPNPLPKGEREKGEGATPYLFTGQELDRESDLSYYGARYYDATLARFHSRDPVLPNLPYAYVSNNPVRRIDPTGRADEEPTDMGQLRDCNNGVCWTLDDLQSVESESLTPVSDQMLMGAKETALDIGDWGLALLDLFSNANVSDACIAASGRTCVSQDPVPRFYGIAGMAGGSGLVARFITGSLFKSSQFVAGEPANYALIRLSKGSGDVHVDVGLGRYERPLTLGSEAEKASEIFGSDGLGKKFVVARINGRGFVYDIGDPGLGRVPASREEAQGVAQALRKHGLIDLGQKQPKGSAAINADQNTVMFIQKEDGGFEVLDVQNLFKPE